ncbi:MAG: sialidase family protein [Pseudomonadales bacterium]
MFKKIAATVLLFASSFLVSVSASAEKVGHQVHNMEKMWTDMRTKPVGMAVSVAADEKGVLWLAQMREGFIWVSHSNDRGAHFSNAVKVNVEKESILAEGQNRPQIIVRNGVIAVAWSQALPKTFASNIRFARSTDGGKTFSAPITINDVDETVGHSFPTMTMNAQGKITLAWIDGRDKSKVRQAGRSYEGSAIYYASSNDGGASFSGNKKLADHTCECCRLGITTEKDGTPVVFWRHLFDGGVRDFAFARLNAYTSIVRASQDNWQINACPHHGGDIAVGAQSKLHLVWFTGNPEKAGLFYRRLDGEHMTIPHAFGNVDAQASYPTVFAQDKNVYVAWREFDGQQYQLMVVSSNDQGQQWSSARAVAQAQGNADLPMFIVNAQEPLLVWNDAAQGVRIFDLQAVPVKK